HMESGYAKALDKVMEHKLLTLGVFIATGVFTVILYATSQTGFFPQQDTGFPGGTILTSQDASFAKTNEKARQVTDIIGKDPDVAAVFYFIGGNTSQANLNITLKTMEAGR